MIALIVGSCTCTLRPVFRRSVAPSAALLAGAVVLAGAGGGRAGQERLDPRDQRRIDEANRQEAGILVELVDRAEKGQAVPAGLELGWRHDFLKAEPGHLRPVRPDRYRRSRRVAGPARLDVRAGGQEGTRRAAGSV
jgi:hypothetical protein